MADLTTQCSGCGLKTFIGERIRHAKDCSVAALAVEEKRARIGRKSPAQLEREVKQALADKLTQCDDPALTAQLSKDFNDHDK